jgi:hypothetical protein
MTQMLNVSKNKQQEHVSIRGIVSQKCYVDQHSQRSRRLQTRFNFLLFGFQSLLLLSLLNVCYPRGDASNSIWSRLRRICRGRQKSNKCNNTTSATFIPVEVTTTTNKNEPHLQSSTEERLGSENDNSNDVASTADDVPTLESDESVSGYNQNNSDFPPVVNSDIFLTCKEDTDGTEEEDDDEDFRFFSDWRQQNNNNISERRNKFLERISIMLSTLFGRDVDASILPNDRLQQMIKQFPLGKSDTTKAAEVYDDSMLDLVTPQSDLSLPGRYIHIVTTAALPWFTGTAVNPLLRAAYLHRRTLEINKQYEQETIPDGAPEHIHFHHNRSYVTLVIPWLELNEDQIELYNNRIFETPAEQEEYIRDWLRTEAKMEDAANDLEILFYPARYHSGLRSVFAMGDIMDVIPTAYRDVCILEEPEHCNCKY